MRTKDSEISGKSADIAERAQKIKKKQASAKVDKQQKASIRKSGQSKAGCPQKWTRQSKVSTKVDRAKASVHKSG